VSGEIEGRLWPVYLVADESDSMHPHMDELNAGIASIRRAMMAQPMTAAKIRFTLVSFSGDAIVRMHLVDLRDVTELAPLTSRDCTNYGAVFDTLRQMVPKDVATLKSQRYAVYRPAVFFLSDGEPTDGETWLAAHRSLTDRAVTREAPNVIAFGIGDARSDVIRQVATSPRFAFIATPGIEIGKALAGFFTALTQSLVASTRTDTLTVEPPAGFSIPLDEM
jgi:uncharacterized protein YegL